MDNQEAFTRIVQHLRRQGAKSTGNAGTLCRYRQPHDGRRCAIGVLITDEFYSEDIEGKTCLQLGDLLRTALPGVSLGLLGACQIIHDIWPVGLWEKKWAQVAKNYELVVPVVEDVPANVASIRYQEEVYAL